MSIFCPKYYIDTISSVYLNINYKSGLLDATQEASVSRYEHYFK